MNSEMGTGPETTSVYPLISPRGDQTIMRERPKIMIIDDSPTVRKIVETCLGREGYEVMSFPDGVAALQWLARPDARLPALVILDITLPKMDGYKVAQSLTTKYQHISIIMLTRRNGIMDKLKARLAGAQEYLVKPFQTKILLDLVRMYT
jgi:twitching motility two-component system response regulator PilG